MAASAKRANSTLCPTLDHMKSKVTREEHLKRMTRCHISLTIYEGSGEVGLWISGHISGWRCPGAIMKHIHAQSMLYIVHCTLWGLCQNLIFWSGFIFWWCMEFHQAAVMVMEDSTAFNAGRGSKLTVSMDPKYNNENAQQKITSRCLVTWRWTLP